MSDIVRSFRIQNGTYRRGEKTMDEQASPFRLPSYRREAPTKVPEPVIEGVPPIGKPVEDVRRKTTNT
jgi:hypothetical protein